jgi:Na+/melibiose symporter-like transporter
MTEKKQKTQFQTTGRERLSFGIYGVGLNIFFVLVGTFLQQYYLVNAAVPAGVVAGIFLVVKIWDGVNDPLFGIVVDKARMKSGKFLPWMRAATVLLPLTGALLFFVPLEASVAAKALFLFFGYVIYDVACTMTEVPYFAVTTAMTTDSAERSHIISTSKIISMAFTVVVLFIPDMYAGIGWRPTALVFAGIAMAAMLPGCFMLRERSLARPETPPRVAELLRYIKSNKYMLIFFLSAVIYGLTNTTGVVGNLFAIYNLRDEGLIAPLLLAAFVPGVAAIAVVRALLRRFDKLWLQLCSLAVTGVASILMYLTGYQNMVVFCVLIAIRGFSTGAHTMLFFLFTPDFAEYGAYITGVRAEGVAFSIQSFASKLISAISSASSLFILSLFGFAEGADTQSAQVQNGIWLLFSVFIVVGVVLQGFILVAFHRLRDRDIAVMTQANHGEISYGEAEKLLGGRYTRRTGA